MTDAGEDGVDGRLRTRAPFHLEATVRVLQRRPTNLVDVWEGDRYLRVLGSSPDLALVEVQNRGTIDEPDVRYSVRHGNPASVTLPSLAQTLRKVLGLDVDPGPLQHLAEAERKLRPTALALRGMRPPRFTTLFEALANVVPFQQLSLDAGVATVGRLVERFGERVEQDGRRFHAFPAAGTIAKTRLEALRGCGLSSRKASTLLELAKKLESGDLIEHDIAHMSTNDALVALGELPGIGPWSAAVVLLRGFGRLDVFPPGDVGALNGLSALMRLQTRASLAHIIDRFGDRQGYLYFCSLGGNLLKKGLIHAAPLI